MPLPRIQGPSLQDQARAAARKVEKPKGCSRCAARRAAAAARRKMQQAQNKNQQHASRATMRK